MTADMLRRQVVSKCKIRNFRFRLFRTFHFSECSTFTCDINFSSYVAWSFSSHMSRVEHLFYICIFKSLLCDEGVSKSYGKWRSLSASRLRFLRDDGHHFKSSHPVINTRHASHTRKMDKTYKCRRDTTTKKKMSSTQHRNRRIELFRRCLKLNIKRNSI